MLPTTAATSIRTEFCLCSSRNKFTITEITNSFNADITTHVFGCFYAHLPTFFGRLATLCDCTGKSINMHNFNLKLEFYNEPILLTEEEMQDPLTVIREFFDDVKLLEVRTHLHNLLEVALTRPNTIYDEASERDATLCFIKQLEKIIESAFLIK